MLRERLELAVVRGDERECAEAARALVHFCEEHPEYSMLRLIPGFEPAGTPKKPQRIASQYETRCRVCSQRVTPGDFVFWTSGERGVLCLRCGGENKP